MTARLDSVALASPVTVTKGSGKRITTCPSCSALHVVAPQAARHACRHCGTEFALIVKGAP